MNTEIRNCEFKFKCPKIWDSLTPTADERIRLCGECDRRVIFCRTATELKQAIIDDECVAVRISTQRGPEVLLGEPQLPPYMT
ncbi:hypothetical protein AOB54_06785 [beta proteobacterium MWH-UniP1]